MFVVSNRNIIISTPDGTERYSLARGYMGTVPEWVTKTDYFRSLVDDGKIAITKKAKDSELENAVEAATEAEAETREKAREKAIEEKEKLENAVEAETIGKRGRKKTTEQE